MAWAGMVDDGHRSSNQREDIAAANTGFVDDTAVEHAESSRNVVGGEQIGLGMDIEVARTDIPGYTVGSLASVVVDMEGKEE